MSLIFGHIFPTNSISVRGTHQVHFKNRQKALGRLLKGSVGTVLAKNQ